MPSRWMTLAIIGLWLMATGWMGYRDILPRFRTGQPPHFDIDLPIEVGGQRINWEIFHNDASIGFAETQVKRLTDRTLDLRGVFRFENVSYVGFHLKKIESNYHVNPTGKLLSLEVRLFGTDDKDTIPKTEPKMIVFDGKVEDGMFVPRLDIPFLPQAASWIQLSPVPVSDEGHVLNSMHPLNKLPGLYEGQTWQVPLADPMVGLAAMNAVGGNTGMRVLTAEVLADTLTWKETSHQSTEVMEVPCWRIDYSEGRRIRARTWVRRNDGLVLQQTATLDRMEITLKRELKKARVP